MQQINESNILSAYVQNHLNTQTHAQLHARRFTLVRCNTLVTDISRSVHRPYCSSIVPLHVQTTCLDQWDIANAVLLHISTNSNNRQWDAVTTQMLRRTEQWNTLTGLLTNESQFEEGNGKAADT